MVVRFIYGMEQQMIKVPYELNKEFYETIKDEPYAKNVEWHETPGQGHIVPHQVFEDVADFFQRVFQ